MPPNTLTVVIIPSRRAGPKTRKETGAAIDFTPADASGSKKRSRFIIRRASELPSIRRLPVHRSRWPTCHRCYRASSAI